MNARLQPGTGLTLTQSRIGQALSARGGSRWRHPWKISPFWVPQQRRWMGIVEPGFVNEECPIVRTTAQELEGTNTEFGINPLSGEPYFSADVFTKRASVAEREKIVDVPLYLSPAIPLPMRAVGWDGGVTDEVPEFFKALGAAELPATSLDAAQRGEFIAPPRGLRLLRACDVILHQPRLALTSQITLEPGPATGISNVSQRLGVKAPLPGDVLRILAGRFLPQPPIDPLTGIYEEAPWDELLIGTVFLLSPPGTPPGREADGTWQPFVREEPEMCWNLSYLQPYRPFLNVDPRTPFIPPLAGGAAQPVVNFLTASLNDLTAQALNILSAQSLAGYWWTPTGGGSHARFPIPTPAEARGLTGLDRAGLAAAQAARLQARQQALKLNADFPFAAKKFPTALLAA